MKIKRSTNKAMTRSRAERISAIEGQHLSKAMQTMFADFDRKRLDGDQRRAKLIAHFKNT